MCSPCSGAGLQVGRPLVELHRHRRQPVGRPALDHHLAEVAVGQHLRVGEQLLDRLHRRPRRVELAQELLPLLVGAAGEHLVEGGDALGPVRVAGAVVDEAGVVAEVRSVDEIAQRRPVPVGLEEHQLDVAAVRRAVGADERVDDRPPTARGPGLARPGARPAGPTTASTSPCRAGTRRRPSRHRCESASGGRWRSRRRAPSPPLRSPMAPRGVIG